MYSVNEKRLEKKRQLRENIEEYLANSFCTVQTELELLEKTYSPKSGNAYLFYRQ